MADFVAVIRRAVDGLSDNTPEMRVKVYEKARGAVLRQLESMKPRPPEEMLRRQLDKLEAAILEVEAEHAEAQPALDEPENLEPEILPAPVADEPAPPEEQGTYDAPAEEAAETWSEPQAAAPVEEAYSHQEQAEPAPAAEDAWQQPEPVAGPEAYAAPQPAVEPAAEIRPVVQSTPPGRTAPMLWEDEVWADEEQPAPPQQVEPEPLVQAETVAYHEPERAPEPDYHPEPTPDVIELPGPVSDHGAETSPPLGHAEEEPAPAATVAEEPVQDPYWQEAAEQDVPADFPVEEPVSHYGRAAAEEPVAPEVEPTQGGLDGNWPEDGLSAPVTARVARERWSGTAVYQPAAEEAIAETAPELVAAYEETQHADAASSADPLGWQQQTDAVPVDVEAEPAEFVEVGTVQGELAAAAQDTFDQPVLHGQTVYEPVEERAEPVLAEVAAPVVPVQAEPPAPDPVVFDEPAPREVRRSEPQADAAWDDSPFSDVPLPASSDARRTEGKDADPQWDEFQDFEGFEKREPKEEDLADTDLLTAPPEKPARSYRIQERRRIDFTSLGLGLLGLALVAGSGYGAWTFRDTLSGLVTGLVSTPPTETQKSATEQTPAKPATTGTAATTGAGTGATAPAPMTPTDTASAEPDIQKFTQRLQPDGTEVDEGTGTGSSSSGEGRSLAPQTVASSEPAGSTPPTGPNTVVANTPAIPTGVSQKMYLYEERVGQTSPVAVEGAVVWSLKHEKTDDGKEEAIVQAQVSAPERGLSALISFKRNLDPSLPASHLVELVFSLPKEFEGGAIESVQRVALKQTEQDRGDPLIAVPAKITDDFHMIALNDYADARDFNLKLLQTRDWIDIPVTYRNGRRALITMEKGSTGAAAFNQAIGEWRALDPSTTAVPANSPPAQPAPAPANPQ